MSKLTDALHELGIFNNRGMLMQFGTDGDVAIQYHRPTDGRAGWGESKHTLVWSVRPTKSLKKSREFGSQSWSRKFFGKSAESFPVARQWAEETFETEFDKSPFGGLLPVRVIEAAKKRAR